MATKPNAIADLMSALDSVLGDNDDNAAVTQFINTGYEPLNQALSGRTDGGLPFGRMVECFGESSSGKCLTAETHILSEHGLTTIAELYDLCGYKTACVQKQVPHTVGLVNENNRLENTSHLVWNGRRKFKRIKTVSGRHIEATLNHPLRVMNARGELVWRNAGQIAVGDYLPTMRDTRAFGKGVLTADEATLIGYLTADGACNSKNKISFSNTDVEVVAEYSRLCADILKKAPTTRLRYDGVSSLDHDIHSQETRLLLSEKYGLAQVKSAGKVVPLTVRTAGEAAQVAFLRAYFELECYVESGRSIEVISASRELLNQVQLMLLNIGINSSVNVKMVSGYEQSYWRLHLSGRNYDKYLDMVGFATAARRAVSTPRESSVERTYTDCVPCLGEAVWALHDSCSDTNRETNLLVVSARAGNNLTYGVIENILKGLQSQRTVFNEHLFVLLENHLANNFIFDEVASIEDGEAPTFDVVVPGTHSFWANGFISHNTALATEWMVQAQKMGGVAGFIDWERSFDVGLAKGFGLNDERPYWLYHKAETWESGNTWATRACKAIRDSKAIPDSAPILFVFDSIAAAIPMSMLYDAKGKRREMDSLTMNDTSALSRVTSTTLKMMAQCCEEYNATFLYLNQVRLKIGIVFGDPRTTPGGKAMEYYSTARMSLGRTRLTQQVGGGKEFVGQNITIEVTKSKLTKPFKKAELRMMYDEDGVARFDTGLSLTDALIAGGVLAAPSNGYVTYEGKRLSKRQMAEILNTDKVARKALTDLLYPEINDVALAAL